MEPLGKIIKDNIAGTTSYNVDSFSVGRKYKKTRFYVDNEYFENHYASELPHYVTVVYFVLARFSNSETQSCFPSIKTISDRIRSNRNYVIRAIKLLESYNIILVKRYKGTKSNEYRLNDVANWKPICGISGDTAEDSSVVSNTDDRQYQNSVFSGIEDDTLNHINKSDNEIKQLNKRIEVRKQLEEKGVLKPKVYENDKIKESMNGSITIPSVAL